MSQSIEISAPPYADSLPSARDGARIADHHGIRQDVNHASVSADPRTTLLQASPLQISELSGARPVPNFSGLPRHAFATVPLVSDLNLHLKLESFNPGASIKDKAAREMLAHGLTNDLIVPGKTTVVESSSGNLGIALARQCASLGVRFCVIVDPNIAPDSLSALRATDALILMVDVRDEAGGFLGARIREAEQLSRDPRWYWTNQYANPANPRAHFTTTGPEIADSFEKIDKLFIPAGTCGTLTGVGRFMKRYRSECRVIAVDSVGSVTFGGRPGKRYIPGVGTSRCPENRDLSVVDHVQMVSEADAIVACRRLARRHGLLLGGSTGSAVAAAVLHHRLDPTASHGTCVGISPDGGEKYLATIFNDTWVEERFGRDPILRGAAAELEI